MKRLVVEIEGVGMADSVEKAYRLSRSGLFENYELVFKKKDIEIIVEKGDRPADIMRKYQSEYNRMLQERMKKNGNILAAHQRRYGLMETKYMRSVKNI